jgi:L-aspartate oxidase
VADPAIRGELQRAMTRGAGVLRSADSLAGTAKELTRLASSAHARATRPGRRRTC